MRVIQLDVSNGASRGFAVQFIPGEYFIIENFVSWDIDIIVDINGPQRVKLFKNKRSAIIKLNVSGPNCLNSVGSQAFDQYITSIEYVQGFTILGFADGKILKINGTGGTGQRMFNVIETAAGFKTYNSAFQSYIVGSHKFQNKILDIVYIEGATLICFEGGKILKINGTGGGGYNLFAITEYSNSFSGIPGYNYYSGHEKLTSDVTNITCIQGLTLIAFKDGRQIKIGGNGGTGSNMFKVIKTNYGYKPIPWTYELHGSNKFNSHIVNSLVVGDKTFFTFADGRIMKISGSGGTGQNMFNVAQTSYGFQTYSSTNTAYLLGSYKFHGSHVAIDLKYINGYTYIMLDIGFVLKILETGGTGQNMFNIAYGISSGSLYNIYYNAGGGFASYLFGGQEWTGSETKLHQITQIDEFIFIMYCNNFAHPYFAKFKSIIVSTSFVNMFGTITTLSGFNVGRMESNGESTSVFVCSGRMAV